MICWRHIVARHFELKNSMKGVLSVVFNLDEVYVDDGGVRYALRRSGVVSDYLVVVYVVFCRCFCFCVWAIFLRFVFFVSWCIWFVLSTILWSFFVEFV